MGISWGAIRKTMGNYDVFVGGSWDTPGDALETMLHFLIVKIKRKPFILWREDWDWNVNSLKRKFVKVLVGFFGRNSDAILVPGSKHRDFFISLGVEPENIFIMPNVSNITVREEDYTNRDELEREFGFEGKKVILYVGRLIDLKGVNYLIEAFSQLSRDMEEAVLLIVGEGECKKKLEKLSEELGIQEKVYFTGSIDNELLGAYYLLSNVFVLPSITTYFADACPLVVNEAMTFGKPVITSDAVGTTFMIEDGKNGFVVPERNSEALYRAIEAVLSDDALEKRMGYNSKELIEKDFTYKRMLEGFQGALDHLENR
jgi:glycosyltransferase involved in cell wall biosynthesis